MHQHELTERILALHQVPTLAGLSPPSLAQLAASLQARSFRRGEVLLVESAPATSIFLLREGTVTLRRRGFRIGTVRAPGGVGLISFLARNAAGGTSVIAETFTEGYEISASALDDVFEDQFSVLLGFIRFVAERLHEETRMQPPSVTATPPGFVVDYEFESEIDPIERISLLRRTETLGSANLNSLATLARRVKELRAPSGTALWRIGDPSEFAYILVKGCLETRWKEGEYTQLWGPGQILGGIESLLGQPRWNDLKVTDSAVALVASRDAFIDLLEDDLDLALQFLARLATRLSAIWDKKAEEGIASVGADPDAPSRPALRSTLRSV